MRTKLINIIVAVILILILLKPVLGADVESLPDNLKDKGFVSSGVSGYSRPGYSGTYRLLDDGSMYYQGIDYPWYYFRKDIPSQVLPPGKDPDIDTNWGYKDTFGVQTIIRVRGSEEPGGDFLYNKDYDGIFYFEDSNTLSYRDDERGRVQQTAQLDMELDEAQWVAVQNPEPPPQFAWLETEPTPAVAGITEPTPIQQAQTDLSVAETELEQVKEEAGWWVSGSDQVKLDAAQDKLDAAEANLEKVAAEQGQPLTQSPGGLSDEDTFEVVTPAAIAGTQGHKSAPIERIETPAELDVMEKGEVVISPVVYEEVASPIAEPTLQGRTLEWNWKLWNHEIVYDGVIIPRGESKGGVTYKGASAREGVDEIVIDGKSYYFVREDKDNSLWENLWDDPQKVTLYDSPDKVKPASGYSYTDPETKKTYDTDALTDQQKIQFGLLDPTLVVVAPSVPRTGIASTSTEEGSEQRFVTMNKEGKWVDDMGRVYSGNIYETTPGGTQPTVVEITEPSPTAKITNLAQITASDLQVGGKIMYGGEEKTIESIETITTSTGEEITWVNWEGGSTADIEQVRIAGTSYTAPQLTFDAALNRNTYVDTGLPEGDVKINSQQLSDGLTGGELAQVGGDIYEFKSGIAGGPSSWVKKEPTPTVAGLTEPEAPVETTGDVPPLLKEGGLDIQDKAIPRPTSNQKRYAPEGSKIKIGDKTAEMGADGVWRDTKTKKPLTVTELAKARELRLPENWQMSHDGRTRTNTYEGGKVIQHFGTKGTIYIYYEGGKKVSAAIRDSKNKLTEGVDASFAATIPTDETFQMNSKDSWETQTKTGTLEGDMTTTKTWATPEDKLQNNKPISTQTSQLLKGGGTATWAGTGEETKGDLTIIDASGKRVAILRNAEYDGDKYTNGGMYNPKTQELWSVKSGAGTVTKFERDGSKTIQHKDNVDGGKTTKEEIFELFKDQDGKDTYGRISEIKYSKDGSQSTLYDKKTGRIRGRTVSDAKTPLEFKEDKKAITYLVSEDGQTVTKITYNEDGSEASRQVMDKEEDIEKDPIAKQLQDERNSQRFLGGETRWANIGAVLSAYRPMSKISNLLFGESMMDEWRETVDQIFVSLYFPDTEYYASEVCSSEFDMESDGVVAIETASGEVQFIASIQAEKSSTVPKFCDDNPELNIRCKEGEECITNVCKKDDEIIYEKMYKVTYAVQAPRDDDLTPDRDEEGALSYNIYFDDQCYYINSVTQSCVDIQLGNGQGGQNTIIDFLNGDYSRVCIKFGKKPKDRRGDSVSRACTAIKTSDEGYRNVITSQDSDNPASSSTTQSDSGGEVAVTIVDSNL